MILTANFLYNVLTVIKKFIIFVIEKLKGFSMYYLIIQKTAIDFIRNQKLLEEVTNIISNGGAINNIENIICNLNRIDKIFLLYEFDFKTNKKILIGTSAIKNPNKSYAQKIFNKFNKSYRYEKELGYVCINKNYRNRGFGKLMFLIALEYALENKFNIFLTCRSDNISIIKIINKFNINFIGNFESDKKIINFYYKYYKEN